ncbi:lipopolysaccharide transport system ATP-binding protein [Ectothiorhodospira magna]|uniref:Lipopolysaccharide transport system ATP-binding protein n=1 Tax=Ectothiorhodospira magna TaxID=867345 RepID=A0A1H9BKH1_9GAMM|nr:ABC transporter ATP-binding protein [Ectothiorhodospira magna]SEP89474.1 lipopolysaccharide transport system ATP-binding protein [Ectothiorhodospira magna]
MNLLTLQQIGKVYRTYGSEWRRLARLMGLPFTPVEEHWVLQDIHFTLGAGEALGIVGRNGAGKSTLLKLITGTIPPSQGQLWRRDGLRIAAILELGLGFVPEFTGRRNALHTAELMGHDRRAIEAAMPEIEAFADIGDYFDQPVRTYSTGMQARVAFATVTAFRPDLLIVDEALSVGDAFFQAKCFERIARYREQGMALILVTHAMNDVIVHCDRALLLHQGRLLADGPPVDITNRYFDTLFTRRPATVADQDDTFTQGQQALFHTRPGYRKEEHRWGEGGAEILDVQIRADGHLFPAEIPSGAQVEFAFKVRFDQDYPAVVPGLLIKTLDGVFVYGTNAHDATAGQAPPLSVRQGQCYHFAFALALTLNAGDYLISFGISSGDPVRGENLVPLDRRYDALILHVHRPVPFWGIADLGARYQQHPVDS